MSSKVFSEWKASFKGFDDFINHRLRYQRLNRGLWKPKYSFDAACKKGTLIVEYWTMYPPWDTQTVIGVLFKVFSSSAESTVKHIL